MTSTNPDPRCEALRDDLAALATSTLTGRRRAEVLDHLQTCPACSAELDGLSGAVDALMTLVPEAEPPDGFAERTIALMRDPATDGSGQAAIRPLPVRRPWAARPTARRVLALAAVVVAVAFGVGIGTLVAGSGGPAGGPGLSAGTGTGGVRTAALQSASGADGSVVLAPGHPGWLVMAVADAGTWGTVTCRVTLADGTHRVVGRYPMTAGYGSWAARLPVPASSVRSVELVGDSGSTLATARLPSPASA